MALVTPVPNLISPLQVPVPNISKIKIPLPESIFQSTRCLTRFHSLLRSDGCFRDLPALPQPPNCDMADYTLFLAASAAA